MEETSAMVFDHIERNEALKNNTYDILRGEFDESITKQSEVPFYNSIKCNPQPITTISEEIPYKEF